MSNEYTLTPEDTAAFHRAMGTKPPREARRPRRVFVIWLLLLGFFVTLYRTFSNPAPPGPGPDVFLMGLAALSVVVGWIASRQIKTARQELTGGLTTFATIDGVEMQRGGRRMISPWSSVTDVRVEGEFAAVKTGGKWAMVPLRAFDAEERAQFVAALEARAASHEAPGVDAPRLRYVLTPEQQRESHRLYRKWWGQVPVRVLLIATVSTFALSTAALAMTHSAWWGVATVIPVLVLWGGLKDWLQAQPRRDSHRSVWIGSSLRVLTEESGSQIPWSDLTAWGESGDLVLMWQGTFLITVLRSALPPPVLDALRERLQHLPAVRA